MRLAFPTLPQRTCQPKPPLCKGRWIAARRDGGIACDRLCLPGVAQVCGGNPSAPSGQLPLHKGAFVCAVARMPICRLPLIPARKQQPKPPLCKGRWIATRRDRWRPSAAPTLPPHIGCTGQNPSPAVTRRGVPAASRCYPPRFTALNQYTISAYFVPCWDIFRLIWLHAMSRLKIFMQFSCNFCVKTLVIALITC